MQYIDVTDLGKEFFIFILVNSSSTCFRLNNFQRFRKGDQGQQSRLRWGHGLSPTVCK